jgi:hypothetical protein
MFVRNAVDRVSAGRWPSRGPPRLFNRPALAAMAHIPEHPLVTTRRLEMAAHRGALGIPDTRGDLVGRIEHRAHDAAELFGAIGADPTGVQKIRRTPRVNSLPTSQ